MIIKCVNAYSSIHTCTRTCICMYVCIVTRSSVYLHVGVLCVRVCLCMCVCMFSVCMCACVCAHVHVCSQFSVDGIHGLNIIIRCINYYEPATWLKTWPFFTGPVMPPMVSPKSVPPIFCGNFSVMCNNIDSVIIVSQRSIIMIWYSWQLLWYIKPDF